VLVVFVDALGPDQIERFGASLSFVPHRRALHGILGYSSGALPTLLTGVPPSAHGRMCLFARSEQGTSSPLAPLTALGFLPRIVHERGRLRRALGRLVAELGGLTGYVALHRVPPEHFAWLDLPEREDLFQAERIGGQPTFLADARRAGLSVYAAPWQLPEVERWEHARRALAAQAPDLSFLYAAELDGILHRDGPGSVAAQACRTRLAGDIERARDALGRHGEVTTLLVGDHGMAEVERVIDPRPFAPPDGVRHFVDSTMIRYWGDASALAACRAAIERGRLRGRWIDHQGLVDRQAPTAGSRYGDALFLLDEGGIFAPSFLGGAVRGMHGYDLDAHSCSAALASDRPLPADVIGLQDVARLVRAPLGLLS
jgi:hypothetical protein